VNLIGEHTDYTGGFVLPMAIQLGTTVELVPGGERVVLESDGFLGRADIPIDVTDPAAARPDWARYIAGVVAALRPLEGGTGRVTTTLPIGAGLSSSAALEVAAALALGCRRDPLVLARVCQDAEHRASGVPCGIMDQLTSAAGVAGHALLIDCAAETVHPVPVPQDCAVIVVDSGERRRLDESGYGQRRAECEAAEKLIGPLRQAGSDDLAAIDDLTVRARARHVISENARVRSMTEAMAAGDLAQAGQLMLESHASLRDDYEVSTSRLDGLVADLASRPGVYGARLTGAGFGGCVIALTEPGAIDAGWTVVASAGARILSVSGEG
jgi:galactokinase